MSDKPITQVNPWDVAIVYPLIVTHTFRCVVPGCGASVAIDAHCRDWRMEVFRQLPKGWRESWGALVCDKHTIHCRVDNGVEFTL